MQALSVNEVNSYIKKLFIGDMILSNISVEGEISNFKKHHSGHMYFSLKDDLSRIKCVMFKGKDDGVGDLMEEGKNIVAKGYISVYEKGGDYQLYVNKVEFEGLGDLHLRFQRLKEQLALEGLFSEDLKKPLPRYPKKIGIITSPTGAALKDILSILKRRNKNIDVIIYPSLVQGNDAANNLVEGLNYLNKRKDIDLIIIGRGGGSMEELFCFNDEKLARTIFKSKIPIISAVGHEIDFTISDFVADKRAATPSEAAELCVESIDNMLLDLDLLENKLFNNFSSYFEGKKSKLNTINRELIYNNPKNRLGEEKNNLYRLEQNLIDSLNKFKLKKKEDLLSLDNRLKLSNPLLAFEKGYSLIMNLKGEKITTVEDLIKESEFTVVMKDGSVKIKAETMSLEE